MAPPSDAIRCAACPDLFCSDRAAYREHCATEWHKFNLNQQMMGHAVLSESDFASRKDLDVKGEKIEGEHPKSAEKVQSSCIADRKAKVCIAFDYKSEKWTHKFSVDVGNTVLDLKRTMLCLDGNNNSDDVFAFSLKRGMVRMTHFDTIDSDVTFDFHFVGPEEGQRLYERDLERYQRDARDAEEREKQRRSQAEQIPAHAPHQSQSEQGVAEFHQSRNENHFSLVSVLLHIDQEPGRTVTLRVKLGTPIKVLKTLLAAEDVTGKSNADDFLLVDPFFGATLTDDEQLQPNWDELDVIVR